MGLLAGSYSLTATIQQLSPIVMNALATAATRLSNGSADSAAVRWFGDDSSVFKKRLASDLRTMRSVINVKTITIGEEDWRQRNVNTNASAWTATSRVGLGGNVFSLGGNGPHQNDTRNVFLDLNFKHLPMFLPTANDGRIKRDRGHQSQLNTLIHELTHLLIGTADENGRGGTAYGARFAARLAREFPDRAKNNAENWGIFVEACGRNLSS